jgi:lipoprotein-anchoring transpeptidase ErfK/SrfK
MWRPRARALVSVAAACAASLLIVAGAGAQDQPLLDPGWQLAVPQGQYAGGAIINGGILESLFGDGGGQPAPMPPPSAPAPADSYRTMPAPQRRAAPSAYARPMPAPPPGAYQAAPGYGRAAIAPPASVYEPAAPAFYQTMPAPPMGAYQVAPAYVQPPAAAPRGDENAPIFSRAPPAAAAADEQPAPALFQPMAASPPAADGPPPGVFDQPPWWQQRRAEEPPADPMPAAAQWDAAQQRRLDQTPAPQMARIEPVPRYAPSSIGDMMHPPVDPKYDRQIVDYPTDQKPGTIVIDTPHFFLYLVLEGGKAIRYGIGVGRPGFTWAGMKEISAKREWPDWYPPEDMLRRRPDLPRYMAGGPSNPLGARALYLGSTLYRIHGSNEPWTIGTQVSSGCIRLRNADIIDLYERVKVGTKVLVL